MEEGLGLCGNVWAGSVAGSGTAVPPLQTGLRPPSVQQDLQGCEGRAASWVGSY